MAGRVILFDQAGRVLAERSAKDLKKAFKITDPFFPCVSLDFYPDSGPRERWDWAYDEETGVGSWRKL